MRASTPSGEAIEVVRLAGRGDGVTADGRYVPLAVPGDRASFAADGAIAVAPGPLRATPPCAHFPACGGCQMQHVPDALYTAWATARIVHALAGRGVDVGETMPPHLSPPRSRRRATLRAVLEGGAVTLGFNAAASHRVIDLGECHVLRPELFALIEPLRALLGGLIPPGQASGVSLTWSAAGADVLLSNVAASGALARFAAFAQAHDLARLAIETGAGIDIVAERRAPFTRLGGVAVALPPAAFLQATAEGEAALVAAARAACAGASAVADLFSGLGTFALPLAAAARVRAVDAAGGAMVALGAAARESGRRLTTEHRDLFRRPLAAAELARFDAVLFDPPRAGAKEQAAEIARSRVPVVVAVSCNPATFARDAGLLAAGGYRLERLWTVCQFRWSNHVELAAAFRR